MGRIKYVHLTKLSDKEVTLDRGPALGWNMAPEIVPQYLGYVSVVSRRYNERQTISFQATTEKEEEMPPKYSGSLVYHPPYPTPNKILSRPERNNGETDRPTRDEEVVPRLAPLPRVANTIEEKVGEDRAPEGSMEGGESNKDRVSIDRMTDRVT